MLEGMTFSERLKGNLKLISFGILKPKIKVDELLGMTNNGNGSRNLQDCCYEYVRLRKNKTASERTKEKVREIAKKIEEKIKLLTRELEEDENRFMTEGTYEQNRDKLERKYYSILGWRRALEIFTTKEFKEFSERKSIEADIEDARRWSRFTKNIIENSA